MKKTAKVLRISAIIIAVAFVGLVVYANRYPKPLSARVYEIDYRLYQCNNLKDSASAIQLEEYLQSIEGVSSASVNWESKLASIVYKTASAEPENIDAFASNQSFASLSLATSVGKNASGGCPVSKAAFAFNKLCNQLNFRN